MFKVGSQLFTADGPGVAREIIAKGGKIFLDLKFHDIPNTVTHAAIEAADLGASMMTVHASGGRAMMQAVSTELVKKFGAAKPTVVAVTVLTSFDTRALFEIGLEIPVEEQVQRLAHLRKFVGPNFKIVTPGIRLPDQSLNDQQRIATPKEALAAGADYIVIGRAVTEDPSPRAAVKRLVESITF
jgi:orotidine-5'-phosphate decarboxylase